MLIKLSPQRRDDTLEVSVNGDILTVNSVSLDFSPLAEGATLPSDAVDNVWVVGDVERINGEIQLTLLMPHGPTPSQAASFPTPITATSGKVELPK